MSDRIKRVSLFMARNRWAVSTNRKLSKVWTIDFRILKKRRFQCVLIHLAEKKRITFSVRKSREFSPIFPNIVNNSRGRRKFSFYLELEIHRCAWYASFCSVIVHRSNYRSSLIKSLSLSVIIVVQVFENTFENKLFLLSSRSRRDLEVFKTGFPFENVLLDYFSARYTPFPRLGENSTRVTCVRRNWITQLIELRDVELERRFVDGLFTKKSRCNVGEWVSHDRSKVWKFIV